MQDGLKSLQRYEQGGSLLHVLAINQAMYEA